jgi:hypothetical protein
MINFFRNIRRKLLNKNSAIPQEGALSKPTVQVGRYILYALGEIVLIVFGILLALYLNNLNTVKNSKLTEILILKEIRSNLQSSIISFNRTIETEQDYLESNLMILDYLDNRRPYNDVLDKAFANYFWTISTNPIIGGYDYLKSKGVDLVTNDSLRKSISFVFENEFSIVKNENDVWANNMQQNISYPYHVGLFRTYSSNTNESASIEGAKPFNYEALLDDNKFKSINSEIITNRKWNINSLQTIIVKVETLITQVDVEIEYLSD